MKGGKTPAGYTIVEVMIVLAVSGMMLVIAGNFVSGKQQKTAFTQGVNEMASRIQGMIEQVSDGQYSDIPFRCIASGPSLAFTTTVSNPQGENSECVFMGKLARFNAGDIKTSYQVFSLAGARIGLGGSAITDLSDAKITPVRASDSDDTLTTQHTTPQNLDIQEVTITPLTGSVVTNRFNFGFMQSLGEANAATPSSDDYATGAQKIAMIYASHVNVDDTEEQAASNITNQVNYAALARICMTDGTRYATITVGENNNQLNVETKLGLTACP